MSIKRLKNVAWAPGDEKGNAPTWERVIVAVLLDVRDELQKLNTLLHCSNFTTIPTVLRGIRRNTSKRRKPKAKRK